VPADAQRHASVLRHAALGDVELRHHLDAADEQRRERARRLEHVAQHAVDPEADDEALLLRLDMHVGRAFLHRFEQQRVDQPDDRRVVAGIEQIVDAGRAVGERGEVHVAQVDICGGVRPAIGRAQGRVEFAVGHRDKGRVGREALDLEQSVEPRTLAVDALDPARAEAQQHTVAPRESIRKRQRRGALLGEDQSLVHAPKSTVALTRPGAPPGRIATWRVLRLLVVARSASHASTES